MPAVPLGKEGWGPCEQTQLELRFLPACAREPRGKETKHTVLCNKILKDPVMVPHSIEVKARDLYLPPPLPVATASLLSHWFVLLFLIH